MTPTEFKAWFDGFTEAMSGAPNKEQWARIKKRVAEIDGKTVTERVYIDRYWPTYGHGWQYMSTYAGGAASLPQNTQTTSGPTMAGFNGLTAMNSLGKADFQSLAK